MIFGNSEDWKEELSDEAKQTLSKLFEMTRKYKYAYTQADDVKVAQLWSALVEMQKEIDSLNETLGKVQEPFNAIISIGEAEKRKTIEKLVSEMIKPVDQETQEATKKLVESLMKF